MDERLGAITAEFWRTSSRISIPSRLQPCLLATDEFAFGQRRLACRSGTTTPKPSLVVQEVTTMRILRTFFEYLWRSNSKSPAALAPPVDAIVRLLKEKQKLATKKGLGRPE
ncbi:hypothetical protein [Mesorhizobium sp.]|uniref:hypothetical protein n=1 Tax=Mesorhizobium sp. TaxID=1871066 RepID=UPI0012119A5E|nr:hypothetical protein [Mesorhizobium sp.]TIS63859.1 MAG: hypothetical protein E5W92_25735 [Mesorhizobium sp.]